MDSHVREVKREVQKLKDSGEIDDFDLDHDRRHQGEVAFYPVCRVAENLQHPQVHETADQAGHSRVLTFA